MASKLGIFVGLMFLLMTAFAARAGIIHETHEFDFPLSPNSATLSFEQFDDHGGLCTLQSVTLYLEATEEANVASENNSAIPGLVTLQLTGFLTGDGPAGLSTTVLMSVTEGPVSLDPSDGETGSGPDFHDFGLLTESGSDSHILTTGLGPFIGTGFIDIEIFGSGGFVLSGIADSRLTIAGFRAFGDATITYEYQCIPEPATLILLTAGGVGLILRRRRRC